MKHPQFLLLGGGYVLQYLAKLLPMGSFVITSRSPDTVHAWQKRGWLGESVETQNPSTISACLKKYPSIDTLIDSVAPQDFSSAKSHENEATARVSALRDLRRVIYLSTTGVFGVDDGSWVDELTPCGATHQRALARISFEDAYSRLIPNSTALRIPAIYGPGRGIGHALKAKRYPMINQGERWSNRIQVEDLARAIQFLLELRISPRVLCVSDSHPSRLIDLVNYYCEQFKLPSPSSITLEEAAQRGLHTMLSNQLVSSKKLTSELGFQLNYPTYREGAQTEFAE